MALDKLLGGALKTTAFRLAALSVAGFLLMAALTVGLIFWQTNKVLTGQVLSELNAEMRALKADSVRRGGDALREAIAARSLTTARGLYFLSDSQGHKAAGNLSRLPPEIDPKSGGVFRYAAGAPDGDGPMHLAVAVSDEFAGQLLVVGRDVEEQRSFAEKLRRIFLIGFGLLSAAGLLGGLAVSRLALRRLGRITETSRSIMAGDMTQRIPLSGAGDELDDLSGSLNAMLERIEQLMTSLREVSDNIAHDLKTPLTRLRNKAESALRDARGPEAYKEGLERTLEEADGLIKTFNALLLVARLEAGALEENATEFDLTGLVEDVAELYEPVAEESGLVLKVSTEGPVMLKANRQLIGQAVANLIDNAIKYAAREPEPNSASAPHQAVEVFVQARDRMAEVRVCDSGPGIGEKDRERVLKRFVRLEQSRTRPGTGLGLSLVAAVARLHKGGIRLEDNNPGLRVVLALPQ